MDITYTKLESIFKNNLSDKINSISVGNYAHEVIEEIEIEHGIEISEENVSKLMSLSAESSFLFSFLKQKKQKESHINNSL
ncbi:MAG: hypothetical protein HAW60_06035 [Bdellovibrionales bacterium]|nr:hypothetical protein [Bdellovibrionales bacterium]